jgi:hypothetical protein
VSSAEIRSDGMLFGHWPRAAGQGDAEALRYLLRRITRA